MADLAGAKIAYLGFSGLIDSGGVAKIAGALNTCVNEQFDRVYLCFNSLGGYVGDGIYLYNHIRALPVPLTIHNTGTVASIGVTVFVAAETRKCSGNSVFMIHPVQVPSGSAMATAPLQAALDAALKDEERTEAILRERAGIADEILAKRRTTDVYLTADDALKHGLVNDVAEFALPAGNKIFHL
ncbi:MAG: ATP-dependent Clp protease proteolytic subunit [Deltaproteobacteria bacterium]|nr:ATP-dependent Clp protease proteolytic subunit [Deltaproteobacteria bacterium]